MSSSDRLTLCTDSGLRDGAARNFRPGPSFSGRAAITTSREEGF
jgi:hypothetical protein